MTLFRKMVIVAGMVLAASVAVGNPSPVLAAENAQGGDGTAAGLSAAIPESAVDASGVVIKLKKSKKRAPAPEPEPLPGQKLTLKQVSKTLKTTRNLSGRNLSGLKLVGIDMSKCNLKGADLNHANLERADLGESNLERANFTGANLKMANLRLSAMTGAKLDKADLSGAIWQDGKVCAPASIGQCRESVSSSR